MKAQTYYQQMINQIDPDVNARWVEAFMRLEHGTLNHLSIGDVQREINMFKQELDWSDEPAQWEEIAESFGL